MAPTETIFAQARPQPRPSSQETRRSSTTVDATGCIITRGFEIPSRTSSLDSVAVTSSASSVETRDKGLQRLPWPIRDKQSETRSSMLPSHRLTKSTGSLDTNPITANRAALCLQRETWQSTFPPIVSSRWEDDELAETICKTLSKPEFTSFPYYPEPPRISHPRHKSRRAKSEQVNMKGLEENGDRGRKPNKEPRKEKSKQDQEKMQEAKDLNAESAIASDSEGSSISQSGTHAIRGERITYAERRAKNDARNAGRIPKTMLVPMTPIQPVTVPKPQMPDDSECAIASDSEGSSVSQSGTQAIRGERVTYAERRAKNDARNAGRIPKTMLVPMTPIQPVTVPGPQMPNDSAIVSDEESDDDDTAGGVVIITAAMLLAKVHRSRNSETATKPVDEEHITKSMDEETITKSADGEHITNSGSKVNQVKVNVADADANGQDGSPVPRRELRPSKSRPQPAKGVLKSRSQSRRRPSASDKQA